MSRGALPFLVHKFKTTRNRGGERQTDKRGRDEERQMTEGGRETEKGEAQGNREKGEQKRQR